MQLHQVGAIVLTALAAGSCGGGEETAVTWRPPNVVLVSLDTLRADHVGAYGYQRDTTPNLDRVAAEGVLFERAIAQASHTHASHISLFQSRYPTRANEKQTYLAEQLQQHGYTTVGFTGGGYLSSKFGFDRGFSQYEEHEEGFKVTVPMAVEWLESEGQGPFFLFVHGYDIHSPYDPGGDYAARFMTHYEGPVQPERSSDYVRQMMGLSPRDEHFEGIPWDDADRYYMQALYDGGIVQTDELLGELIGALDRNPRFSWAHDILVLFSDHGEEFWDHGSLGHGKTLFQEALHVPLVMRLPGAGVGGRRIPEVVMLMDVAPTLLELARVPVPSSFTGSSLLPLLTGDGERGNRIAVSQTVDQLASMIQFPWKLIRYGQEDRLELYNLEVDPGEHLPLQDDHAALANQLQEALMTQIREGREIPVFIEAEDVDDQALREQLRSLGYID